MGMNKFGLVLEGGGVRGIYTAGVLDFFMEHNITVEGVFGVSAGVLHGLNYMSNQIGRSYRISTEYLKDPRYLSLSSLARTGDIFGAEFCYHTIPEELDLFDYEACKQNNATLFAVVSNVETGNAEYIPIEDVKRQIDYVRASASLPLVSRIVEVNGKKYLDGGICDSIPLAEAKRQGFEKNIVVLTRPEGYQKEANRMIRAIRRRYRAYPKFSEAVQNRHIVYNETLQYIEEEAKKGTCLVIRPSRCMKVSRLEKNTKKIRALYELGYEDAKRNYENVCKFLGTYERR